MVFISKKIIKLFLFIKKDHTSKAFIKITKSNTQK